MKRTLCTLSTLTTLAAVAAAFAGVAQTTQAAEPNYEFILDASQALPAHSATTEAVYEFQLDDGRSLSAAAQSPAVSYEFILAHPAPSHAQMSAATNYEFQLYRDGGAAPSAARSVYASTAAGRPRAR